ncbi:VOC family protein [Pseudopelagicola sp. nBUS_19]|uniref:VOC family protein n=1 Tax=Pseudopelagicola sp. nBUS_19 TaxID=3395316 RepID=UPI003EB9ABD2
MLLDHLAVAGETVEEAVSHVEESLGVKMLPGGNHLHFGTHNQLLGLADGLYLEAIAIDPNAESLGYARWFDLDRFQGPARLHNWICRVDDLDTKLAELDVDAGQPVALARGDLKWRMAVPASGILPFENLFPALIQWDVACTPGDLLARSGCALIRVEIAHPDAETLTAAIGFEDSRIAIEIGSRAMRAIFETPHGKRVLSC